MPLLNYRPDREPTSLPSIVWHWPAVAFAAGLALTAALAWFAWSGSRLRDAARFETAVQQTTAEIQTRLEVYTGMLRAGAGLFAAQADVSSEQFRRFAERLDLRRNYPGVQGLGFARHVPASQRAEFLAGLRRSGGAFFEAISPPGEREEYFPIVYLEPLDRRNRQAIGYDMFSEPTRRDAMARARDAGRPAASGRVVLVQEIDPEKQAGFLIYVPVYRGEEAPANLEERRARIAGFVYSPFRSGDLFTGIFRGETLPQVAFEVFDGINQTPDHLLYRSPNERQPRPAFTRTVQFPVADRTWSVRFEPGAGFKAASSVGIVAWVSVGGLLVSTLLGGITLALARAEARSRARGRELFARGEQLRVTLSSIGDAVMSTDAGGRIAFMNPVAEQLTGWSLEEARGRALGEVFSIVDEDTGAPAPSPVERVQREGNVILLADHTELISRHGARIPIDDSAAPIRSATGELLGVVLVFQDVTEKRRADEALRVSEARKDAILRSALDAIVTVDHERRIVEFNPAAERIFARSRADMLGHPVDDIISPPHRPQLRRIIGDYLATGEGPALRQQFELPARRGDGTEFPAELAVLPLADAQPPMFTVFLRDITERKLAEQRAREASERLQFLAESMPQKIVTTTPDGTIDYVNRQWKEFTGLSLEQIRADPSLSFVHPDDREETLQRWRHSLATGDYLEIEHRFRRHDGVYVWHLSRARAMRNAAEQVVLWIGSSTDIDAQKRDEERLEKTVEQRTAALRETNEQLEAFVYTIAHDLRAPLRAIGGYSQILSQDHAGALDAGAQHLLRRIQSSAEFMDRLILDLIAFGRTSRVHIELSPVDVQRAWSIALAQTADRRREQDAEIETLTPLPRVRAHEPTLGQVLANLLGNSLKFVAPGVRPRIRFRSEDRETSVRLWLEDNGIGIAPEQHERVFRVFERLNGSRYGGTGIGLSIVRKGVERMGGTVGVESAPGQGSRFWIELPKAE